MGVFQTHLNIDDTSQQHHLDIHSQENISNAQFPQSNNFKCFKVKTIIYIH